MPRFVRLVLPSLVVLGCASDPARLDAPAGVASVESASASFERGVLEARLGEVAGLAIVNPYGDVRLRFGGYEDRVLVQYVEQRPAQAAPITLDFAAEHGRLQARLPAHEVLLPGQRLDLVVFVPKGYAVRVQTETGAIEGRGIQGDVDFVSGEGAIAFRAIAGRIRAETGGGTIEGQLEPAPEGSAQRIATRTGAITLAVPEALNAAVELATSGVFATEFSLEVEALPGQEPNKRARAAIGKPLATLAVESKRGEIRLLRRAAFRPAGVE